MELRIVSDVCGALTTDAKIPHFGGCNTSADLA